MEKLSELGRKKQALLIFPLLNQPCPAPPQLLIGVARMHHPFADSGGKVMKCTSRRFQAPEARESRAMEAAGGPQPSPADRVTKIHLKNPSQPGLDGLRNKNRAVILHDIMEYSDQAGGVVERVSDPWDAVSKGNMNDGIQHRRKDVDVLVTVQVRWPDPMIQKLFHLKTQFAPQVLPGHTPTDDGREQSRGTSRQSALSRDKSSDVGGTPQRRQIGEDQMDTDPQIAGGSDRIDGMIEGPAIGHERGASKNAPGGTLDDGIIDTTRKAKIVTIDDQKT